MADALTNARRRGSGRSGGRPAVHSSPHKVMRPLSSGEEF